MSLGEILVVGLVALFVTKPQDLPVIITKIKEIRAYFDKIKQDIYKVIELNPAEVKEENPEDIAAMNDYLKKIIAITGEYKGDYNLVAIKKKYTEIITKND